MCRYRSISLLLQYLFSLIMALSNLLHSSAITTSAHRYWINTFLTSNIRSETHNFTAVFRVLEIIVRVVFFCRPFSVMMQYRGVDRGEVFLHRWSFHLRREDLGHRSEPPDVLREIFLPITMLFWGVTIRMTNVAAWRLSSSEVATNTRQS